MPTRPSYRCLGADPRVSAYSLLGVAGLSAVLLLASKSAAQPAADIEQPTITPSQPNVEPPLDDSSIDAPPASGNPKPEAPKLPPPADAKRLSPDYDVWIDKERKLVLVDGQITLRRGPLEMFACPKGTKEHESVVACHAKAYLVHAALLSLGAEPGTPVRFDETYHAPTGTKIAIDVYWLDAQGDRQKVRAQDWVRDARTKEPMDLSWVFAGSGFWKDETTGEQFYMAEAGDFICVSNFSTAMLDVPAESSQANDGLLYEANTEKIPPLGTWVRLVLRPELPSPESPPVRPAEPIKPVATAPAG